MKFPIRQIIFEVTQECNLSCLYCYNHWRRKGYVLEKADFKQTRQTLKKILASIDFEHITFTGGEPILADGLKEHILTCRMHAKGVSVISNGTTATAQDYRDFSAMGISLIEFPMHSYIPAIHDQLTNVPDSFTKVLQSIDCAQRCNLELCVICVVTKINIEDLGQTLAFIESLGIKRFMLARFNIGGRGIEYQDLLVPTHTQLRNAFLVANEYALKHPLKISANVCLPPCIVNHDEVPEIAISSCGSQISGRPITIDFSGNVRMCNHSPIVLGNIHTSSLEAIFSSEKAQKWKTARPEYCLQCSHIHTCNGGCKAASEQMGLPLENEDPMIHMLLEN